MHPLQQVSVHTVIQRCKLGFYPAIGHILDIGKSPDSVPNVPIFEGLTDADLCSLYYTGSLADVRKVANSVPNMPLPEGLTGADLCSSTIRDHWQM